jgi:hypothetical protein
MPHENHTTISDRQQHRQVIHQRQAQQREHPGGGDGAARRLAKQAHQLRGDRNAHQHQKSAERSEGKFAQQGFTEDHAGALL